MLFSTSGRILRHYKVQEVRIMIQILQTSNTNVSFYFRHVHMSGSWHIFFNLIEVDDFIHSPQGLG